MSLFRLQSRVSFMVSVSACDRGISKAAQSDLGSSRCSKVMCLHFWPMPPFCFYCFWCGRLLVIPAVQNCLISLPIIFLVSFTPDLEMLPSPFVVTWNHLVLCCLAS